MAWTVVLVTGATGFVGKHLVSRLLAEENVIIVALTRRGSIVSALCHERVVVWESTLSSASALSTALTQRLEVSTGPDGTVSISTRQANEEAHGLLLSVDVVIHLAACMEFFPSDERRMYETNVHGTRNLVRACERAQDAFGKQILFIYCSTTETLGGRPYPSEPLTEEDECKPQYTYGVTKVLAEEEVRANGAVPHIILRPTGVFGRGDGFVVFELMQMISWGLMIAIPGHGQARLMFTHVSDVCSALMLAMRKYTCIAKGGSDAAFGQTIIIAPDEALTYEEWIRLLSDCFERAQPVVYAPLFLMKWTIAVVGPLFNIGKPRTFMFESATIDRMGEDRHFSNAKARALLGFAPRYSLRAGLREVAAQCVQEGRITVYGWSPMFWACMLTLIIASVLARVLLWQVI